MAQNFKTAEVTITGARVVWASLHEADTTYKAEGTYGIGIKVNQVQAQALNHAAEKHAHESQVPFSPVAAGDTVKITMAASGVNKKTKKPWEDKPLVYLPSAELATAEDILQIGKKTVVNVTITLKPWENPKKERGLALKLTAVQVVKFDAGAPTAAEVGFSPIVDANDNDSDITEAY